MLAGLEARHGPLPPAPVAAGQEVAVLAPWYAPGAIEAMYTEVMDWLRIPQRENEPWALRVERYLFLLRKERGRIFTRRHGPLAP